LGTRWRRGGLLHFGVRSWLETAGWLACVVYATIPAFWLMVHPFAARWRQRRRSPYRILLPLWMAMWVVLALLTSPWRAAEVYRSVWAWLAAAAFFAAGVWLYTLSGRGFSLVQLGGLPEVLTGNREQRLVMHGLRSHVRHPVYLAHLCEMVAWSVGTGLAVCWSLTAFAILTGTIMIRLEDRELEARFGDQYRAYRRRVGAVIPRRGPSSQL